MRRNKISAERTVEIGSLFEYQTSDVTLPPSLDPIIYPKMNLRTAKAWFQLLSIVQETTPEENEAGIVAYSLPALDFAKRMNMPQLRGEEVQNAMRPLTKIPFRHVDGDLNDLTEANILDTNLLMAVRYRGKESGKPLEIYISAEVNTMMYEKKMALHFAYEDVAKLNSINSIHVFACILRLREKGISQVPLESFKTMIGLSGKYNDFWNFRKRVLDPVEKDIRQNTSFSNFRFYNDGTLSSKGKKAMPAENIGFIFDEPVSVMPEPPSFTGFLDKEKRKKIESLSLSTQKVIFELCNMNYDVSQYLPVILKSIRRTSEDAFRDCATHVMTEASLKKTDLRTFFGAILSKNLAELKKKPASKKKTAATVDASQMKYEDQQRWIKTYTTKAKQVIAGMSLDRRRTLIAENKVFIQKEMSDPSDYDERSIVTMKMDGRKKTVKALYSFLAKEYYYGKRHLEDDLNTMDSLFRRAT